MIWRKAIIFVNLLELDLEEKKKQLFSFWLYIHLFICQVNLFIQLNEIYLAT